MTNNSSTKLPGVKSGSVSNRICKFCRFPESGRCATFHNSIRDSNHKVIKLFLGVTLKFYRNRFYKSRVIVFQTPANLLNQISNQKIKFDVNQSRNFISSCHFHQYIELSRIRLIMRQNNSWLVNAAKNFCIDKVILLKIIRSEQLKVES